MRGKSIMVCLLLLSTTGAAMDESAAIRVSVQLGPIRCPQIRRLVSAGERLRDGEDDWASSGGWAQGAVPAELETARNWSLAILSEYEETHCGSASSAEANPAAPRTVEVSIEGADCGLIRDAVPVWDNKHQRQLAEKVDWVKSEAHLGFPFPYLPWQEEALSPEQKELFAEAKQELTRVKDQMRLIGIAREVGVVFLRNFCGR